MTRLPECERWEMLAVTRHSKVEWLKMRRANAHILLDNGHSKLFVARVLLLAPNTLRNRRRAFEEKGMASLDLAVYPAHECHLTAAQEAVAKVHFRAHPAARHKRSTGVAVGDLRVPLLSSVCDQADAQARLRVDSTDAAAEAGLSSGVEGFCCEL